ncbi:MAG: Asp-tRNA(Asn)/Glu-tRNA(Gln) amidotransferase subunit GatC [Patescibacteria group bacterium]
MDKIQVLSLAKLARIKIGDQEAENLSHEFESILKYVGEVGEVGKLNQLEKFSKEDFLVRNVMRKDSEGHESGLYTEKILAEAPAREGDYIKVKKIL